MKIFFSTRAFLLVTMLGWLLAGPGAAPAQTVSVQVSSDRNGDRPTIGSNFLLESGETYPHDKVVIGGSARIDGTVDGDLVVIGGDATINGKVTGEVVVILGGTELGPEAVVGGELVDILGVLKRAKGAQITGDQTVIGPDQIPGLSRFIPWVTHGLLWGRLLTFDTGWPWCVAAILLLFNLVLQMLFPRPIQASVDAMEKRPISSLFVGILTKILTGFVTLLLVVSVVGLIVVPFLSAALIVAFLFGKITVYQYAGQQLGRHTGWSATARPAVALVMGTAIFYLLYAIPFLGIFVWSCTGLFGLGAVVLAAMQQFRRERPKLPPSLPPAVPPANPGTSPAAGMAGETVGVPPAPVPPAVAVPALAELTLLPRAGFWIRFGAVFLDGIVMLIPILFLFHNSPPGLQLVLLLWLAYHVALWAVKGTTVGGIVMGLRVVRLDGRPVDFPVALVRGLASSLSFMVLGLGFFWAGLSRSKQSWHDMIAGTVIVKVPRGQSLI